MFSRGGLFFKSKSGLFEGLCPDIRVLFMPNALPTDSGEGMVFVTRRSGFRFIFGAGGCKDFFLPVQKVIGGKSNFQCADTQSVDCGPQTLLHIYVLPVPKHYLFDRFRNFLKRVNSAERCSHSLCFSPGSADKNTAYRLCVLRHCCKGTFSDTDAASCTLLSASIKALPLTVCTALEGQ